MDGIPVEVWKCLAEEGIDLPLNLMQVIYEQEKISTEWRDSVIIPIYKEKGDIQDGWKLGYQNAGREFGTSEHI